MSEHLWSRVGSDVFDVGAWASIIRDLDGRKRTSENVLELRNAYESLLSKFPTSVSTFRKSPGRPHYQLQSMFSKGLKCSNTHSLYHGMLLWTNCNLT
jgi:hypothetical protein